MSDQKPKIRQIVFERRPLRMGRFFLFTGIGVLIGVIFAVAFYLIMKRSPGDVPDALVAKECWPYVCASVLLGLTAGLIGGWGWDRAVEARVEMVDIPRERRSPAMSTALIRTDVSGRSRY